MAEFTEVCKQALRMLCEMSEARGRKPGYMALHIHRDGSVNVSDGPGAEVLTAAAEDIEKSVMQWAAEHPEPIYPTWEEVWDRLFPNRVEKEPPCPRYFFDVQRMERYCPGIKCKECRKRPIPADIAAKLGVKAVEVTK